MVNDEISSKMEEYSQFVSKKLQFELNEAEKSRKSALEEISGYKALHEILKDLGASKKGEYASRVDLGHQAISCQAVGDLTSILVQVGMGFTVDMTLEEAIAFVPKRIQHLESNVLKGKEAKVREITDHIATASAILDGLSSAVDS